MGWEAYGEKIWAGDLSSEAFVRELRDGWR